MDKNGFKMYRKNGMTNFNARIDEAWIAQPVCDWLRAERSGD
jgi:hypothetical protein